MATVTGTLSDFGPVALAPYDPLIIVTPSGPAVLSGRLLATRPIEVTPASNGTFSVLLSSTDDMRPATWYTLKIQWLNAPAGYPDVDYPDWKLFVPAAGGVISELLATPANPSQAWSGDEPEDPYGGLWWLDASTGYLSEWSN